MSYQFFFENGEGNTVDENGNDSREVEYESPFKLEELSLYTHYIEARAKVRELLQSEDAVIKGSSEVVEVAKIIKSVEKNESKVKPRVKDKLKAYAVHLVDIRPRNSTRAVALELNLQPRDVQRWYKARKEDPDSLFRKVGRPRIIEPEGKLAVATKQLVSDFKFKYPTATIG